MTTTTPSPLPDTAEAETSQALELGLVHGSPPISDKELIEKLSEALRGVRDKLLNYAHQSMSDKNGNMAAIVKADEALALIKR